MLSATADGDGVVQSVTAVTLPCDGASWYPLIGWPPGPTATVVITGVKRTVSRARKCHAFDPS